MADLSPNLRQNETSHPYPASLRPYHNIPNANTFGLPINNPSLSPSKTHVFLYNTHPEKQELLPNRLKTSNLSY